MKRKSYMVSATIRPPVTIYYEVIASSAREAIQLAKKDMGARVHDEVTNDCFVDEIGNVGLELEGERIEYRSAGLASQYHHENQCSICTEANKSSNRKRQ